MSGTRNIVRGHMSARNNNKKKYYSDQDQKLFEPMEHDKLTNNN